MLMPLIITAALALSALSASPRLTGAGLDRAVHNYEAMLAGQRQLGDLTPQERLEVIELDRWLRAHDGKLPVETKQECEKRLGSATPTPLGDALLDLKCSQRPSEDSR
jgi:hypothetical protein